ncbi:MAG TPA: hypothetical protein DDW34_01100 [Clostridium sp.]|nr:hypothetical protein [Clostridium sp.]
MKKFFMGLAVLCLSGSLFGCSSSNNASAEPEQPQIPDLTGEWKQVNSNSNDTYHIATVDGETIEISWFTESDETKALYWAGTFVAPETADEPYTWESTNDKEKTDSALLVSGDDTKTFTYEDGQISYEASAMGVTQTVRLEKQQ